MRLVRLPRLRCALLGLLPLWARDGGRTTFATQPHGAASGDNGVAIRWKNVGGELLTKK